MQVRQSPIIRFAAVLLCVVLGGVGAAQAQVRLVEVWRLDEGLDLPESVVYDADREVLYVSNIRGAAPVADDLSNVLDLVSAKDGNGYLSRVSVDGEMLDEVWVDSLDGPKGLALHDGRLFAADIDALVEVDVASGEIVARYPADGATFLNDVDVDDRGRVYVSDSGTGRVYRLAGGSLAVWLEREDVRAPNGVYAGPTHLLVAAADASAENPGGARYLRRVSYDGGDVAPLTDRTPLGGIDAIEPDGRGGYFLSDWAGGEVMHVAPGAAPVTLVRLGPGTADLDVSADRGLLFLPAMLSGRLVGYRVEGLR